MPSPDPREIARRLTQAQKRALLAPYTDLGSLVDLRRAGLVESITLLSERTEGQFVGTWTGTDAPLTPLGAQVRAVLEEGKT